MPHFPQASRWPSLQEFLITIRLYAELERQGANYCGVAFDLRF